MLLVGINWMCIGTRWDDFIRDLLIPFIFLWYFKKFGFKSVHNQSFLYLPCSTERQGIQITPLTTAEYFLTTVEHFFVFMDALCYGQFSAGLPFSSGTLGLLWKLKKLWFNYNRWDNMDYSETACQWNNDNYTVIFCYKPAMSTWPQNLPRASWDESHCCSTQPRLVSVIKWEYIEITRARAVFM